MPTRGKHIKQFMCRVWGSAHFLTLDWYKSLMEGRSAQVIFSADLIFHCSLFLSCLVPIQTRQCSKCREQTGWWRCKRWTAAPEAGWTSSAIAGSTTSAGTLRGKRIALPSSSSFGRDKQEVVHCKNYACNWVCQCFSALQKLALNWTSQDPTEWMEQKMTFGFRTQSWMPWPPATGHPLIESILLWSSVF